MTPEHWQHVKEILDGALERAPGERQDFLVAACAGDSALKEEVESLVASDDRAAGFLESRAGTGEPFSPPLPAGTRVGPYRLLREIAQGGMGTVHLGERADDQYRKRVAIKFLRTDADPEIMTRRFRQERQILADLDHPSVARLLEGGTTGDGVPYIVMEYVDGTPIDEYCQQRGLSVQGRLSLIRTVCSAVAYAHRKQVVHRDIKPSNILVTAEGTPKLLDFGIAKLLAPPEGSSRIDPTTIGLRPMTPEYASPEQVRGEPITTATDLYALGVLMYRLLAGRGPYRLTGTSQHELARAICEQEPQAPSHAATREGRPQVPRDVDGIVLKALRKEPDQRYASVEDLSEDIRRHQEGHPVTARRGALAYRAGKFARRNAAVLAAGFVMLVVGSVVMGPLSSKIAGRPSAAGAETGSPRSAAAGSWWAARPGPGSSTAARSFALSRRVTTRNGVNTSPTLSPDGRAVAYVSDRSGNLEIYVAGLAPGAREIAITSDGMQNMQPDWSPDGQWLAFHSRTRRGVWIVPATGGVSQPVTEFGSDPAWSPDGQYLVFTSDAGGMAAQSALWSVRRDGGDRKELTRIGQPPGGHREPAWARDGRSVVFSVSRGGWDQEVWTVPASGGAPLRVAAPRLGGLSPQFAPDGRAIYWGSPSTGSSGGSLWRQALDPSTGTAYGPASEVMDIGGYLEGLAIAADGSLAYGVTKGDINLWAVDVRPDGSTPEPVRLTHDVIRSSQPDYSPDGRVAFVQAGPGHPLSARLMNDDGTNSEPLIAETPFGNPQWTRDGRILATRHTPAPASFWWVDPRTRRLAFAGAREDDISSARVSPDGRELAFHVIEPTGTVNVWTQPLEGGGPRRRVTSDAEVMSYPAWSPDGHWLVVEIKRGDQTQVGVVAKTGGPVEQLTFEDGQSWPYSWSPDGERIAFAAERGGIWNVWAVSRRTRATSQLTRFTSPSGYVRNPAWSPRGSRIVFERSIRESSVWTVRPN